MGLHYASPSPLSRYIGFARHVTGPLEEGFLVDIGLVRPNSASPKKHLEGRVSVRKDSWALKVPCELQGGYMPAPPRRIQTTPSRFAGPPKTARHWGRGVYA